MLDLKLPCQASHNCQHPVCHECERPIISTAQRVQDHPGATPGVLRDRLCERCKIIYGRKPYTPPEPAPATVPDERQSLLSDKELDRIQQERPIQYEWHINRRWGMYEREMERIRNTGERISPEKYDFLIRLTERR